MKRRGRAKGEFESDEEIEREVRTDSETDDDHSSVDSDSDSESSSFEINHKMVVTVAFKSHLILGARFWARRAHAPADKRHKLGADIWNASNHERQHDVH